MKRIKKRRKKGSKRRMRKRREMKRGRKGGRKMRQRKRTRKKRRRSKRGKKRRRKRRRKRKRRRPEGGDKEKEKESEEGHIIHGRPPYSLPATIDLVVVRSITCIQWLALSWDIWMTIWLGDYMVAYHELYARGTGGEEQQQCPEGRRM